MNKQIYEILISDMFYFTYMHFSVAYGMSLKAIGNTD